MEKAGDKIGIPLGHGRRDATSRNAFIDDHPIIATGLATIVAPVTEELLFRDLPARLLERNDHNNKSSTATKTKLGVAAAFAAAHAGPNAIPLPQFISGLNYSRIHEKRGLRHSILAHVANNTMAAARFTLENRKR